MWGPYFFEDGGERRAKREGATPRTKKNFIFVIGNSMLRGRRDNVLKGRFYLPSQPNVEAAFFEEGRGAGERSEQERPSLTKKPISVN